MAVLRTRARLWMILHRERRLVLETQPRKAAVEQGEMRRLGIGRQRVGIDREAVVHAGDLDPTVVGALDRVVGAAMALEHLEGLRADGEAEQLVAEADAEDRFAD